MLNVVQYSELGAHGRRLVLVHGFTQSAAVWAPMAELLAPSFEVLAVDLPGHGSTSPGLDGSDLWDAANELVQTCGPANYVGYSLGARVVLHAALQSSHLVQSATLIGAKAGYRNDGERNARRIADNVLADRIDSYGDANIATFIDEWLAQPFNAALSPAAQFRDARLQNRASGLAQSLRYCGSGSQEPLWGRLDDLNVRTLLLQGEQDLPTVISDNSEMRAAIGDNATLCVVEDVGHAGPFAAPERFAPLITAFCNPTS